MKWLRNKPLASYLQGLLVMILVGSNSLYLLFPKGAGGSSFPWLNLLFLVLHVLSSLGLAVYLSSHLKKLDFLRFALAYCLYLVLAFFLFLGAYANHPDISLASHFPQAFWEYRFLPTLGFITVLALVIQWLRKRGHFERLSAIKTPSLWLWSGLFSEVILCDGKFRAYLVGSVLDLSSSPDFWSSMVWSSLVCASYLLVFWLLSLLLLRAMTAVLQNQSHISLAWLSSIALAILVNYTLQDGVTFKQTLLDYYLFPGALLYQLGFLTVLAMLVYTLVNRYWLATVSLGLFFGLLSVANSMKVAMRDEPVLVTDWVWAMEPHFLASFVGKRKVLLFAVLVLALGLLGFWLTKKVFTGPLYRRLWQRLVSLLALLGLSQAVLWVFSHEEKSKIIDNIPVISRLNNETDINYLGFRTNAAFKSLSYVWTRQLTRKMMDKPDAYSQAKMEELANKYKALAKDINQERTEDLSDQTVIFVLSESFANPERLSAVSLSQAIVPNIEAIKAKTTSGLMTSDFYGGGTANIEMQALTGLPMANYDPAISVITTDFLPKMPYVPSLSQLFPREKRIGLHPYDGRYYNRFNVYQQLQFAQFSDLVMSPDLLPDPVKLGDFTSDAYFYEQIIKQLDKTTSPFISAISMQNHGPWNMDQPVDIKAEGEMFAPEYNNALTQYARLLYHTDQATKDFLEALKKREEKITLVFYGDHLPGLYPDSVFADEPDKRYQTDYFIWSNYQDRQLDYPLIHSSDLPALLLAHTKAKVTPYYALLTEVLNKASLAQDQTNQTAEQKEIAEDLRLVQYDLTSGQHYLLQLDGFFEQEK